MLTTAVNVQITHQEHTQVVAAKVAESKGKAISAADDEVSFSLDLGLCDTPAIGRWKLSSLLEQSLSNICVNTQKAKLEFFFEQPN